VNAQSKKDFLSKMRIAYKEANETQYWIRIFNDVSIGNKKIIEEMLKEIEEIIKILSKITKTTKESL
jgi:four helix bundle protein